MKNIEKIILGIIIMIVGVIIGTNEFGLTNINIFFTGWWTLFIIVPAIISIFKEENKTGSIIWLTIGIALLLICNDILSWDIVGKLALPVVLIIIGAGMVFSNVVKGKVGDKIKEINEKNGIKEEKCVVFSGDKIEISELDYKGGSYSAVFAGLELDLTKCEIREDCVLTLSAIFAGIDVKLPEGINIKINRNGIFGGTSCKIKNKNEEKRNTIFINSTAMFGGVEIK